MKSNKKVLIFLMLLCGIGYNLYAQDQVVSSSANNSFAGPIQFVPEKKLGVTLPHISGVSTLRPDTFELSFTEKAYKNDAEKKLDKKRYKKLTRLVDVKSMKVSERLEAFYLALDLGYYEDALLYLKHLTPVVEDQKEIQKLARLKADIYLALKMYKKASESYESYIAMYPGASDMEDVLFYYIVTLNEQRLSFDRDQETTLQVIQYVENYMIKESYKKHLTYVQAIYADCYETLYESEKNILEWYVKQKKAVAAEGRYAYLKKQYYDMLPAHRMDILAMGCDVAQLQGNQKLFNERLAILKKEYPSYYIVYGQKHFNKKSSALTIF